MISSRDFFDRSNGYEAVASEFLSVRSQSVGTAVVAEWAGALCPGDRLLDLGCGFGGGYTRHLLDRGLELFALDSSPSLLREYRQRFPTATASCEAVESSEFFATEFDGVMAIGLIFLLQPDTQISLLTRMAEVLTARGRLLFSSPYQRCSWNDLLTGLPSRSLGRAAYRQALESRGLSLVCEYTDEGGGHYFAFQNCP